MQLLSELRYPTRWYSKLVVALLAISFFTFLAAGLIAGYAVYSIIVLPAQKAEAINLDSFPGHPEDVAFDVASIGPRDGWFFPGLKSAPTIVLCPGYRGSREELLPLATALQDHEYNVFLFDFDRHGTDRGYATFGFREIKELRAAVAVVAGRADVDRSRFGLWGTNMGGYTAIAFAESDPRVQALAVESVYDRPQVMVQLLGSRYGLASLPLLRNFAENSFLLINYPDRKTPPLSARLFRLADVPKLFLEATDEPGLMEPTHQLFVASPEPKEEASLPQGNYAGMLDDEKRTYENRIVSFFLLNLAPEVRSRP
jgi:pimeloyl-ACP methyl ester carboxylesterase